MFLFSSCAFSSRRLLLTGSVHPAKLLPLELLLLLLLLVLLLPLLTNLRLLSIPTLVFSAPLSAVGAAVSDAEIDEDVGLVISLLG